MDTLCPDLGSCNGLGNRRQQLERLVLMPNHTKKNITEHGNSMYRYRGCRCDICRAGAEAERKKYRKSRAVPRIRLDATPLINRLSPDEIQRFVGHRTVNQWLQNGIELFAADRWCIKLGYHPSQIWGSDFYTGINENA